MRTKTVEPTITPKNANSRWVAIDIIDSNKILAEGKSPEEVDSKVQKTGKKFMLMFVPKIEETYIF